MSFDKFQEECGVFGIYGHPEAANLTYLGLYALQHRGQESAGIVSSDGKTHHVHKGMGLVADIFSKEQLKKLPGYMAIGHNRYSTTGASLSKNIQPFVVDCIRGSIAIAHNGNLVNAYRIRKELESNGAIFQSTMDSEVIVHLLAMSKKKELAEGAVDALKRVKGAYSLLLLNEKELIGIRDPHGFRPLSLGKKDGAYVLVSETCALDLIEGEFIRHIEPGEMVVINEKGIESYKPFASVNLAHCIFEYIYFSRPDSLVFGKNVHFVRKNLGRELAKETHIEADIVIPVPDSGVPAALGYSDESGIPFDMGLIRNHYVGRTFIEPRQSIRHFGVKIKLNAVKELLQGKRVVVVDDSIVRGTTSRKIVKMIRHAGAKEIHMRISSPPTAYPCFYGIDTPTRNELIAATHSLEEIRKYLTADSIGYLSVKGLLKTVHPDEGKFCTACFTGNYPIEFPYGEITQLHLFEEDGFDE